MSRNKYDIFNLLYHIDIKNKDAFTSLTDEERKQVAPYVLAKWLTGCADPAQVILINEFVNPYCFTLQNHKDLLLKLMTICTSGKKQKYKWLKNKSDDFNKKARDIVKEYYQYNTSQANDALKLLDDSDITELARQLGYQEADIKKVVKKK